MKAIIAKLGSILAGGWRGGADVVGRREEVAGERRAVVVSHGPYCLDGMASAVCVARFYGERCVTPVFTHPSVLDGAIEKIVKDAGEPADLWITDLTWKDGSTEEYLQHLARQGWRIFWVDHHKTALERVQRGVEELGLTKWVVSNQYSAARLVYEYLTSAEEAPGKANQWLLDFRKVVLMADDNDRFLHNIPGSRKLAQTISALGGMDAYQELLRIDKEVTYSGRMREAYARAVRDRLESVELARKTRVSRVVEGVGIRVVGALCSQYVSEAAEALAEEYENAVIVLFNVRDRRVSLRRTKDCEVDLADIAKLLGGGGHPAAAGFDLPELLEALGGTMIEKVEWALRQWR